MTAPLTATPVPTRRLVVAGVAALALVALVVALGTGWRPLHELDRSVLHRLNDVTAPHPDAVHWWRFVSDVGQPFTFQVLAVVTAVVLWRRGRRPLAVFTAATVLGAGLLSTVLKAVVGRARPLPDDPIAHAAGMSFPSGHALSSAVGVAVALVLVRPHLRGGRRRAALVGGGAVVVVLVAFSRLALGVHYLSDIGGGWLLAIVWVALALTVLDRVSARPPRAPAPPSPGRPR